MKKAILLCLCLAVLCMLLPATALAVEYQNQKQNIVRLHVVGASNDKEDQSMKLQVRDAVIAQLEPGMSQCAEIAQVKAYLAQMLPEIEKTANATLASSGSTETVTVSLCEESFPVRHYDTFSLPSGLYTSLRITIGEGQGKNWWCVVFPSFCFSATSDGFLETAAGAGFSQPLRETLSDKENHEIGFFFLDCIGKLENFFHFR